VILLISASQVAGIVGISHWHPALDRFLNLSEPQLASTGKWEYKSCWGWLLNSQFNTCSLSPKPIQGLDLRAVKHSWCQKR
jgi:hypothetical protein